MYGFTVLLGSTKNKSGFIIEKFGELYQQYGFNKCYTFKMANG